MKTYRLSKKLKNFSYLLHAILLIGFGNVVIGIINENKTFSENWMLYFLLLAFMSFPIFFIIYVYKKRVIITKNSIISINLFSRKEMKFEEIKGFSFHNNHLQLESNNQVQKFIEISNELENYNEIESWLKESFELIPNHILLEDEKILNDNKIGASKEIRLKRFKNARIITNIIDLVSFILFFILIIYPKPNQILIFISIIVPIITVIIWKKSYGLITLDGNKESSRPTIIFSLYTFPMLFFRMIIDYEINDYFLSIIYAFPIAISFFYVIFKNQIHKYTKSIFDYIGVFSVFVILFLYGLGIILFINCYYDNSPAKIFNAKILSKEIRKGKSSNNYYMKLSSWKMQQKKIEYQIDEELYNKIKSGEDINIFYHEGLLYIPWIEFGNN